MLLEKGIHSGRFQSTPSAWRETGKGQVYFVNKINFNPLPPHGGRLIAVVTLKHMIKFQSTPSAWRETQFPEKWA